MTTETLYDALETCLQALEQGADIESCLARFPAQAEELRPILETAIQARSATATNVPEAVLRRSKARFLQAAAERREQASVPASSRRWNPGRIFGMSLVSLIIVLFLLVTGWVGLARAAASSLPGDNLYPVKRSWEGTRLFIASPNIRLELEREFEQERVREINQLYHMGRVEQVDFEGAVTAKNATLWNISGLLVIVTDQAQMESEILVGARVQVWGLTGDGFISAEKIRLLTAPTVTQPLLPSPTWLPSFTSTPRLTETKEAPSPTVMAQPTASPQPAPTLTPRFPFPTPPTTQPGTGNENDNNDDNDNDNDNDNEDDD